MSPASFNQRRLLTKLGLFPFLQPSLAARGSPGYATVESTTRLRFPQDHGAHPNYRIEWWYITGQVLLEHSRHTNRKQSAGIQITFFRTRLSGGQQLLLAHAALALPDIGKLLHAERVDRAQTSYFDIDDCKLKLKQWTLEREAASGIYKTQARGSNFFLDLRFRPSANPQLQGKQGFSQKGPALAQASHYYSLPQLGIEGRVVTVAKPSTSKIIVDEWSVAASPIPREDGLNRAWLDHEWSSTLLDPKAVGWDWIGVNLFDGGSIMAFVLRDAQGESVWSHWVKRNAQQTIVAQESSVGAAVFSAKRWWQSPRSLVRYPVQCTVRANGDELLCSPIMDDQELDTRGSTGNIYWEGAIQITDRSGKLIGRGYLELTGYEKPIAL